MTIDATTRLAMNSSPRSVDQKRPELDGTASAKNADSVNEVERVKEVREPEEAVAKARTLDPEQIAKLVEDVNQRLQMQHRSLQFSVQQSSGKVVIAVYDSATDELIRQIPSDETLALAEHMQELMADSSGVGIVLQDQA